MENLMRAQENPPFGWYYKWDVLDKDGVPETNPKSAFKQPETIKVRWIDDKGTQRAADVIPDKGLLGCEFAMKFTFKWFEAQVEYLLPDDEFKERYRLLGHCFQGQAQTKWDTIVAKVKLEDRTLATLREAKMD